MGILTGIFIQKKRQQGLIDIPVETYSALMRLIQKGESDDDLIKRIIEYAKCYMIIQGAEDMDEVPKIEGDLQGKGLHHHGLGGPAGLDWIGYPLAPTGGMSTLTGDLYSHCLECGSMDTRFEGTFGPGAKYKCKKCGHEFQPQIFGIKDDP